MSQSDVQLAVPLGAKILGFNVRTAAGDVEALAKQHGVEVRACACREALGRLEGGPACVCVCMHPPSCLAICSTALGPTLRPSACPTGSLLRSLCRCAASA